MRSYRETVSLLAAVVLSASVGCSSSAGHVTTDSGPQDGSPRLGPPDAISNTSQDAPRDSYSQLPADSVAPPQPEVACAGDAGAAECTLPPSVCALPAGCDAATNACPISTWFVFYENPRCVSGRCVWDQQYFDCPAEGCHRGGCLPPATVP
jgi:hypothetical protein